MTYVCSSVLENKQEKMNSAWPAMVSKQESVSFIDTSFILKFETLCIYVFTYWYNYQICLDH